MATDELKILMQNLKFSAEKTDDDDASNEALNALVQSLTTEGVDRCSKAEQLVNNGVTKMLVACLQRSQVKPAVQCKVAELVAELAKTDVARKPCSDPPLISLLVELLLSDNAEVALQACRALGNICYENDQARSLVNEHNGTETLLQLLKNCLSGSDGTDQLRVIATGVLLNLTNTYELTQEKVLEAGVINILCEYLERYWQDEDLCTQVLLTVNCIADSELGRQKIMGTNMCQTLIRLLNKETNSEVIDTVLELLGNLAESDAMKFQLASSSLCPSLSQLIKDHYGKTDEDSLSIIKTASELIILLLTGDDSMVHLYNDGQGVTYKESISWLHLNDDTLQIASALAIGNFARRDEHCCQMVENGITDELLSVLKKHSTQEGDIRLQHAVLSALRNLAIPVANKAAMNSSGVVDVILPMAAIETYPVVFKLLGTLRMLVDKQESVAVRLGKDDDFLRRLLEWCSNEDHPGVTGEGNRLLAWIIKNSNSSDVMRLIVESGGMPFLVSMSGSEHTVMQNEALIALTLIAATVLDESENDFQSTGIVERTKKILQDDNCTPEVKANTLALITALTKSDKILESMKTAEVPAVIKKLSSDEAVIISDVAKRLCIVFESG